MPLRCTKCNREVPASQAAPTMDTDRMAWFRDRMQEMYGEDFMNLKVMELDTRYMDLVVEDANRHGLKCPGCGATAWASALPAAPAAPSPDIADLDLDLIDLNEEEGE